jgi:hypothetical protein
VAKPKPGIYYDVSFAEYQSWEAYNPSIIKVLLDDSPLAMRHTQLNGSESTDDMDLGTATHDALLQPRVFEANYVVWEGPRRAGKAWEAFCEENAGKEIITATQLQACIAMRDAVRSHAAAYELIAGDGRCEVCIVWVDSATGALCKGRMDFLTTRRLVDLKTTNDPRPFAFTRQATKLQYHVSMGAYMDGLWELGHQVETAHFIAVGNKPWHDVVRYDIAPQAIRKGIELWKHGLGRAVECERMGFWPGCAVQPVEFLLPDWAMGMNSPEITVGGEPVFEQEAA